MIVACRRSADDLTTGRDPKWHLMLTAIRSEAARASRRPRHSDLLPADCAAGDYSDCTVATQAIAVWRSKATDSWRGA